MYTGSFNVEQRTQEIGRDLFRRVRERHVPFSLNRWLDQRFMRVAMRDEAVKAQLFRLVDALPALRSSRQVNGHLREYLTTVSERLAPPARAAVVHWPDNGRLGSIVAGITEKTVRHIARGFIAASTLNDAERAILEMRRRGLAFTIDVLGEAVVSEAEAEQSARTYRQLVEELSDKVTDVNVSVKLSSLDSQFDPIDPAGTSRRVRDRLRPILRAARTRGAFINFDMEQRAYKDITLRIFREILDEDEFRHWHDVGIAIQAYLEESADDLDALARWIEKRGGPVWVRLVKGAYWDYETVVAARNNWPVPVFTEKAGTDANFERLTTFLLEHHELLRPAIGTHNIRSIAHALAAAERLGLWEGHSWPDPGRARKGAPTYEFQMLYGMAEPVQAALVEMGQRVRVYTPFGQLLPGMAYLVRRLLENTSNESFLRAGFLEHLSEEQLLMKPQDQLHGGPRSVVAATHRTRQSVSLHAFPNEPVADFSREEARAAMRQALESLDLGQTWPLVIGGRRVATANLIESINPSHSDRVVGRVPCAGAGHAREAVAAAKEAFPKWRDTPPAGRVALLQRVAAVMRQRRYELAAWEVVECGKPWREADSDVCEAIDYCEYYAAEMARLSQPRRRDVAGETNEYFYEPRGVAAIIAPWNFPLAILTGMTGAAVVTGNTAIMKPAEPSVVVAAKLMEAFEAAGAPPGVVNYLPGHGREIGPVLAQHPDVALIAFTGSREVGLWINRAAAETPEGQTHVKRVIAEMGGKNAIIVDDDADLDEAIQGVVASAFGYSGQKCSACSRVIALESVYDLFLKRLIEAARSLKVGPAEDPGCLIGPVINAEARDRIQSIIEEAQRACRVAFTGDQPRGGFYVAPHIFADVPPMAGIAQEEIFGPVLAVMKARDLDDALRIANGVPYALTGGFYSRSPANIERVRREFRVGNLYINRKITGAVVDRQPFGGFKMSGIGSKAGGPDYLQQFMVPRTVTENTMRHGFAPPLTVSSTARLARVAPRRG
jgi:RHH-type proline utilization regulon transcriptional repressor/proline dehydrogenase/delta 1-pyrroline-5-carboxylate dehydrogenase